MKRFLLISLVLSLALVPVLLCPVLAEGADTSGMYEEEYVPIRVRNPDINWGPVKVEQEKGDVEYEASFRGGSLQTLEVELEEDGEEYEVVYDAKGRIIRAEYESDAGEFTYDGRVWRNSKGKKVEGPDLSFLKEYFEDYRLDRESYPRNTMSLVGLPLRELYPKLTDKWYHVVPIDLTKEGVFRYKTAVSNIYYAGYCDVTVRDGTVTVDYAIPYGTFYVEKQCMAWFTSIEEITPAFLNNPESSFRYGKPVDIEKELKGQKIALLFMCNRVSYQVPFDSVYTFPARFFSRNEEYQAFRSGLMNLLHQMQ